MAVSIGNLNVKLGLDMTGMSAGIAKATTALSKLGGAVNGIAPAIRAGFSGAASAAKYLEDAVSKPFTFIGDLVKQIPYVGGLLALPFEAATSLMGTYAEGSKVITEVGMAAAKAGASVAGFQTAMYGTKLPADELTTMLFKLNSKVAEAAMGSEEGKRLFDKYGLSANALAKLDVDKRLEVIAEKFKALKDPTLEARMALDLFGRGGNAILPFLNKGPAAMAKARSMLEQTGLRFTDQDFANVKAAGEFSRQLKNLKDSITNQVTIGIAPFLAELNQLFDGLNIGAKGLSGYVQLFAKGFVGAGSLGVNLFKNLMTMLPDAGVLFGALSTSAMNFASTLMEGITGIMGFLGPLVDQLADVNKELTAISDSSFWREQLNPSNWFALTSGTTFNNTGRPMALTQMPDNLPPMVPPGAQRSMDAADKLREAQERLKKAYESFGQASFGDVWKKAMEDYDKFMKGVEARNKEASKAMAGVTAEAVKAMYGDRIKGYEEAAKGPLDRFQEDFRKLQEVDAAANKFGLFSDKTYAMNANKMFQDLSKAFPKQEAKFAAAITEGSTADYSARMAHQYGGAQQDPQARLEEIMKEVARSAKEEEKNGRKVVEALREITRRGI